jgi:hypothetical protein
MANAHLTATFLKEDDYQRPMAERKAKAARPSLSNRSVEQTDNGSDDKNFVVTAFRGSR